jgi:hypothetical protein
MLDCVILFTHHKNDEVTCQNLESIQRHNPDVPIIPLWCDDGGPACASYRANPLPNAVEVRRVASGSNWANLDLVILEWFNSPARVEAQRYIVLEYDTYASVGVRSFYRSVWNADAAAADTVLRGRDDWVYWHELNNLPNDWVPHAVAVSPMSGLMLSRRALVEVSKLPMCGAYCELRLGTMIHWAGFPIAVLPGGGSMTYRSDSRPVDPEEPAIYHPVRNLTNAVVMPYYGEFGWMICRHVRWVHELNAQNIVVCCRRGEECLYPHATEFFYDWPEGIPDSHRCEDGSGDDIRTRAILADRFPHHAILKGDYPNPWAWGHLETKFMPSVKSVLPNIDVAVCPRYREHGKEKNWTHWTEVVQSLRAAGLTVGLVGRPETSVDVEADARAWDHPDGSTAGTVDLLGKCRIYLGGDTGVSHLAAMMDTPTIMFSPPNHYHWWSYKELIKGANKGTMIELPESAWTNPEAVWGAVFAHLNVDTKAPVKVPEKARKGCGCGGKRGSIR